MHFPHQPAKIQNVDSLLDKYTGNEAELLEKVTLKYAPSSEWYDVLSADEMAREEAEDKRLRELEARVNELTLSWQPLHSLGKEGVANSAGDVADGAEGDAIDVEIRDLEASIELLQQNTSDIDPTGIGF